MDAELRVKIADKALSFYIEKANDLGEDIPNTDCFGNAVQQALMELVPETNKKWCPLLKSSCLGEECGWWKKKLNRCAVVDLALNRDVRIESWPARGV